MYSLGTFITACGFLTFAFYICYYLAMIVSMFPNLTVTIRLRNTGRTSKKKRSTLRSSIRMLRPV